MEYWVIKETAAGMPYFVSKYEVHQGHGGCPLCLTNASIDRRADALRFYNLAEAAQTVSFLNKNAPILHQVSRTKRYRLVRVRVK